MITKEEKLQKKLDKMKSRYEDERERVKAYTQIMQMYGAYMAVMLQALGATKDKPFRLEHTAVTTALENYETRVIPTDGGFDMYVEELKKDKENENA